MTAPALRAKAQACLDAWGCAVNPRAWELLDIYLRDVREYNRKVNITAAKDEGELVLRHVLDSWAALNPLRSRLGTAPRIADVGAGAGFIGIGLKLAWPEASVTLIESVYKKYCFLNWTCANMGIKGLEVRHERAPMGSGGGFDAVVARALAPLPDALGFLLPLAKLSATALVYQSAAPESSDPRLTKALRKAGAAFVETIAYRLPGENSDRHLAVLRRDS